MKIVRMTLDHSITGMMPEKITQTKYGEYKYHYVFVIPTNKEEAEAQAATLCQLQ